MKQIKVIRFFLFTLLFIAGACQKEFSYTTNNDELITKSKSWFKTYQSNNTFDPVFKEIDYQWEKAQTFQYPNGYKVVTVPIKDKNQHVKYYGTRLLYLYPWKNGQGFYHTVYEFLPDFKNGQKLNLKRYTGILNSWHLKKGFQKGLHFTESVADEIVGLQIQSSNNYVMRTRGGTITVQVTPYQTYIITLAINSAGYLLNYILEGGPVQGGSNPCEYTMCNIDNPYDYFSEEFLLSLFYDENGFLHQRKQELHEYIVNDPAALEPCDSLNIMPLSTDSGGFGNMWQQVAQHLVPQTVKNRIDSVNNLFTSGAYTPPMAMYQQTLNAASGAIVNCDFFPIKITQLPTGFTAKSLLEYFRLHMDDFVGSANSFEPYFYTPAPFAPFIYDTARFNSSYQNSIGALIHIGILGNDGTVIQSGYTNYAPPVINHETHQFLYSTLHSPLDNSHPVAGNRAWGIYNSTGNPNQYTFYTMGVDRTWDWFDGIINNPNNPLGSMIFDGADELWTTMQTNFIDFINSLPGGQAGYFSNHRVIARPKWDDVKEYLEGSIDWDTLKQRLGC